MLAVLAEIPARPDLTVEGTVEGTQEESQEGRWARRLGGQRGSARNQ